MITIQINRDDKNGKLGKKLRERAVMFPGSPSLTRFVELLLAGAMRASNDEVLEFIDERGRGKRSGA